MCTSNACNLHDLLATMWIFLPQITCKNTICAFVSICKTSKTTREISAFNFPWQDNKNQTERVLFFRRKSLEEFFFSNMVLNCSSQIGTYIVHRVSVQHSIPKEEVYKVFKCYCVSKLEIWNGFGMCLPTVHLPRYVYYVYTIHH